MSRDSDSSDQSEMNFEEKLINALKKHVCLFNKRHISYRKRALKTKAWSEVGVEVRADVKECQHRWRSLRDRYVREMRSKPNCKWRYMRNLTFLNPYLDSSRNNSNADDCMTDEESCSTSEAYSTTIEHEDSKHFIQEKKLLEKPVPKFEEKSETDIEEADIEIEGIPVSDEMPFVSYPSCSNSKKTPGRIETNPTSLNSVEEKFLQIPVPKFEGKIEEIDLDESDTELEDIPVPNEMSFVPYPCGNSTGISNEYEVKKRRLNSVESNERFSMMSEMSGAEVGKSRNEDYYKTLDSYMLQLPLTVQDDLKIEILNMVYNETKKHKNY